MIGAYGVGCQDTTTATLVSRFELQWIESAVRIRWDAVDYGSGDIWLERAQAKDGPWTQPVTERQREGSTTIEVDRSVVALETYWYRLVGNEGGSESVIAGPLALTGASNLGFGLQRVSPNPGSGAIKMQVSLEYAAPIEMSIYDVQGRLVAQLARGMWPAGTHELVWSGLASNGAVSPAGVYVVRFRYPGGQQLRRFVRSR